MNDAHSKPISKPWSRLGLGPGLLVVSVCLHHMPSLAAEPQNLAGPIPIHAAGKPIQVSGNAAPYYGDIDEDGRNDLLVGQLQLGRLRVYRNRGTTAQPEFDDFAWFRANDEIAAVPTGCNIGFVPHLVDITGDRRTDLLTGSLHGEIFLFRRRTDGSFSDAEVLQNSEGSVWMRRSFPKGNVNRYNSTAFACDWDSDGDKDLVLGRVTYCLVLNEGTADRPQFGIARPIVVDGEPVPSGHVGPCMADWDADGRVDFLAGRDGDLVWYRNLDTDDMGMPVFDAPQLVLAGNCAARSGRRPPPTPARMCAFCVADLNGDGRPDLIVGDEYRRILTPTRLSSEQETKKSLAKLGQKHLFKEYRDLRDEPDLETHQQRVRRFRQMIGKWQEYTSLTQFDSRQQFVGRVWLYQRVGN